MIEGYYKILKIDKRATLEQLKKAYRRQAKCLHPDINKNPDAHEEFIFLNEAYEYLLNLKTGKVFDDKRTKYSTTKKSYSNHEAWKEKERAKARARAEFNAKMKYEAFTKTDYFKATNSFSIIGEQIKPVFSLLFLSAPIIGLIVNNWTGLLIGLFITLITITFWLDSVVVENRFSLKKLGTSLLNFIKSNILLLCLCAIINLYFFFTITLNTLVPISQLSALFAFSILCGILLHRFYRLKPYLRPFISIGISPAIINLFFLINYSFNSNPTIENYSFHHKLEQHRWGLRKTTLIILKEEKYSECLGIRIFGNYNELSNSSNIEYEFAEGLFGIRILKTYQFK